MAVVRWNPWHEIDSLQRQFDRMFDDTLVPMVRNELKPLARVPAAELQETDDALLLKVELPGIESKDLDIQVTEDAVSIKGERKAETRSDGNGVVRSEFHYGSFHRIIPLPTRIQNTQVQAEYKNGIVSLTLPKAVEERNKVVKVNLDPATV